MELKIPPPLWMLLSATLMWSLSLIEIEELIIPNDLPMVLPFAVAGICTILAGVWAFHRAGTTVNPHHPERTSTIVDTGIYRITRNPMYLGMALLLVAWAVHLGHLFAWAGIPFFMTCLSHWQIRPEEQALARKFGYAWNAYCNRVRRWL
ncbi:MAG: isoprenylcysteine carboxylmethyltransferase family protein [Lautropia sp.]|nr:isoprenylcysteine carboxylmethyltransferase family protein [Lautropia sp.]